MRVVMFYIAISLIGVFSAHAALRDSGTLSEQTRVAALSNLEGLDPVVTGVNVTKAHLDRWKKSQMLYDNCKTCAISQPFPGDLDNQ